MSKAENVRLRFSISDDLQHVVISIEKDGMGLAWAGLTVENVDEAVQEMTKLQGLIKIAKAAPQGGVA